MLQSVQLCQGRAMGEVIKFRHRGPVKMAFTRQALPAPPRKGQAGANIMAACTAGLFLIAFWPG